MKLLDIIFEDLKTNGMCDFLHFGMGLYIRNKYLWNNKEVFIILSAYYHCSDIDKISSCVINDYINFYKNTI